MFSYIYIDLGRCKLPVIWINPDGMRAEAEADETMGAAIFVMKSKVAPKGGGLRGLHFQMDGARRGLAPSVRFESNWQVY